MPPRTRVIAQQSAPKKAQRPKAVKAATPKAVARKAATPKAVARKAATRKAVARKAAAPKAAARKAATPKAAARKAATPKAATPKAATPKAAAKKVGARRAIKIGSNPLPMSDALEKALAKQGRLRLVHASSRGGKFVEFILDASGMTVREGAVGAAGRVKKTWRTFPETCRVIAVRKAKSLLVDGYELEGARIDSGMMAKWLAEVERIGRRSQSWDTDSERVLVR